MKEIALKAVAQLAKKYQPEFIILYGSTVRGDYSEQSDIDVACFCNAPLVDKDVRLFEGKKLDCWLYSLDQVVPNKNEFLRFVGGELYYDKSGRGQEFLDKVTSYFDQGPEPMADDAREHLIQWANNMLQRAAGNSVESN